MERDEVRLAEQGRQVGPGRAQLALGRRVRGHRILVEDPHPEALGPPGHRAADPAEADHAQGLAVHVAAQQQHVLPMLEAAVTQVAVGLDHAAGGGHQERPREIGGGIGQHVGGIGDHDPAPGAGRDVDVVVAHRHVGDDAKVGAGVQQRLVDGLADHADQPLLVSQAGEQLRPGHGGIDGICVDLGPAPGELDRRLG